MPWLCLLADVCEDLAFERLEWTECTLDELLLRSTGAGSARGTSSGTNVEMRVLRAWLTALGGVLAIGAAAVILAGRIDPPDPATRRGIQPR